MHNIDETHSTIYDVMLTRGFRIEYKDDIDVYLSDFRPHLQKYVEYLLDDGQKSCKLFFLLNLRLYDFVHQWGFGVGKIGQLCADLELASSRRLPVKPTVAVVDVSENPVSTLVSSFCAEEILTLDYPVALLNTVRPELVKILDKSFQDRLLDITEHLIEYEGIFIELSEVLERNKLALAAACSAQDENRNILVFCSNLYFRLIIYRCAKNGAFSKFEMLRATQRLENYVLISTTLLILNGQEIRLDLFDFGQMDYFVIHNYQLATRFELVRNAIVDNHCGPFSDFLFNLDLVSISEKSKQRLEWGWRIASGESLDAVGRTAGISRERVRQILVDYFGDRYRDLTNLRSDVEEIHNRELTERVKSVFDENQVVTAQLLETKLEVSVTDIYKLVPKLLHRFIDDYTAECNNRDDQKQLLIRALQEAELYEHTLTTANYDQLVRSGYVDAPGPQTVIKVFGTWNSACEAAGVNHRGRSSGIQKVFTRTDIIAKYSEFMLDATSTGSISKYEEWTVGRGVVSAATVRKWFPKTADLYHACLLYITTHREDDYRAYVAAAFSAKL
jgi:hypothetical protein